MMRFPTSCLLLVTLASAAAAQTIQLPVTVSQLAHAHYLVQTPTQTITKDLVQFPCGGSECSVPSFNAAITTGTTFQIRVEAPPGQRFAVTRAPGGQQYFSCDLDWRAGLADTGYVTQEPASIVFENLTGPAPADTDLVWGHSVCDSGLGVISRDDYVVNADFTFTAMSVQFTVSHVPAAGPSSYAPAAGGFGCARVVDGNGVADATLMHLEPIPPLAFCAGDGSAAACPCGNTSPAGSGVGCVSSLGVGARLATAGTPSVSADTLVLHGSSMPDSAALYIQGTTQQAGGPGSVFGDGLRCVGGAITRLGVKTNVGGASQYPAGPDPSVSVRGAVVAGTERTYQCWYRNAAVFCTSATFNLSNGIRVSWTP